MDQTLNVGLAFVAGIASFIAPCTLALVPAYLAYLAGFTLTDPRTVSPRRLQAATILNVALFAVGFTAVFVVLGSSLGALSSFAGDQAVWLNRIGGLLIIGFGLITLGLLRVPILERGFTVDDGFARRLRYAGSLIVGGTFAVGWIPCVGPILGAILVLAATTASAASGAVLLTAYSLGIMLPFILAGVFSGWTRVLLRRYGRALQVAGASGGVLLIALGVIVFTNLMPVIASAVPMGVPPIS